MTTSSTRCGAPCRPTNVDVRPLDAVRVAGWQKNGIAIDAATAPISPMPLTPPPDRTRSAGLKFATAPTLHGSNEVSLIFLRPALTRSRRASRRGYPYSRVLVDESHNAARRRAVAYGRPNNALNRCAPDIRLPLHQVLGCAGVISVRSQIMRRRQGGLLSSSMPIDRLCRQPRQQLAARRCDDWLHSQFGQHLGGGGHLIGPAHSVLHGAPLEPIDR